MRRVIACYGADGEATMTVLIKSLRTMTLTSLRTVGLAAFGTLILPTLASAQTLFYILGLFNQFLNALIGLFITLAIVVFFWGLIGYLMSDGEGKSAGLNRMMMGVVTIFVMVSIWGIIRLLQATFRTTSTDPIIPKGIQVNTQLR